MRPSRERADWERIPSSIPGARALPVAEESVSPLAQHDRKATGRYAALVGPPDSPAPP
jgi:hypothetical protein